MNLITNAYHAVGQSGGKIDITLKNVELTPDDNGGMPLAPGNYVKLTVTDNGHGMSPEIVERIFDPYFTTKPKGKGTGLGLATVYGVVKECEGEIRVNSRQGEGTTFDVFFPAMQPDTPAPVVEHKHNYRGGTESILVVDDEDAIVLLLKRMLETLGYKVTERRSSADALEAFLANPDKYDAVITDMTMPGMTGDQLTAELLAIKPELPVIICSGFSEKINRDNAKALGVKAYLMKPIIMSEMAETLRSALDDTPL